MAESDKALDGLRMVLEQGDLLAAAADPHAIAETVSAGVAALAPETRATIYLVVGDSVRFLAPPSRPGGAGGIDDLLEHCNEAVFESVRRREAVYVSDTRNDDRFIEDDPGTRSQLALPLLIADEIEGVLDLRAGRPDAFQEELQLLLRALSTGVATAVRTLRIREELRLERERLETLVGSSADAIITTDQEGVVTLYSPGAEEIFGFNGADVVGTPVSGYYYRGQDEARRVMQQLREKGKILNYETWFRSKSGRGIPASLSCSLLYDRHGRVVGTLGILKDITRQKEMEEKLNYTIERLQEANEQLEVLAVTDNLSGLYNHRYFYRELEAEMERCMRTRRPLSLLLIDIDRFKKFNDTYGHQVGDQIIEEIGRVIRGSIRRVDTGCRYGGEEFTVILPETRSDQAGIVAGRVREGFSGSDVFPKLGTEPTTLSIGVVEYEPRGGRTFAAELVRAADEAMYCAKREGGDAVVTGEAVRSPEKPADAASDDVLG